MGPPITPPNAPSPAPAANTQADNTATLMPVPAAISGSSTAARSFAPISVFSFRNHSSTPTAATTTMTNRGYVGKTMPDAAMEPRNAGGYGSVNGSPPQIMNAASRNTSAKP